ncbi:unnamed protein product [Cuscuta epithymum]|uniref:Secreted protein n=1 Tax=Cuscuta epithymum TaxID=186058 RepID=A0AAV0G3Y8_9ASTE|nr:unnamed protein product [Cuscuta epithymum]
MIVFVKVVFFLTFVKGLFFRQAACVVSCPVNDLEREWAGNCYHVLPIHDLLLYGLWLMFLDVLLWIESGGL